MTTNTPRRGQPGAVIQGALQVPNLLAALFKALEDLDPDTARAILDDNDIPEGCDLAEWALRRPQSARWLVRDDLPDALAALAPPGHYFGFRLGDVSDLGFWPLAQGKGVAE